MDRDPTWKLELLLRDPTGRVYSASVMPVDVYDMPVLTPPREFDGHSFETAVQVIKEREKRTIYIRDVANALGAHLAQRLPDKEGWHGESRAATIQQQDRDR